MKIFIYLLGTPVLIYTRNPFFCQGISEHPDKDLATTIDQYDNSIANWLVEYNSSLRQSKMLSSG
jgi:hypothetical protein